MNFKKKLWRLLSVLSTLLLVILPISGCDYSFSAESNTETGTYTTLSETTDSTSDSATEQNKTSNIESGNTSTTEKKQIDETDGYLDKDGSYTSKEDIMNYLIESGQLPNNLITNSDGEKDFSIEIYNEYLNNRLDLLTNINRVYANYNTSYITELFNLNLKEQKDFYETRQQRIEEELNQSYDGKKYTPQEKEYWLEKSNNTKTPFEYDFYDGYSNLYNTYELLIFGVIAICICLASVFAGEYQNGTDKILLTTKYGKSKGVTAKIIASYIFATLVFTIYLIFAIGTIFLMFGTDGGNLPIQLSNILSPYALTFFQSLLYNIVISYTVLFGMVGLTLFLSSKLKNPMTVLVIDIAIIMLPVFLSIKSAFGIINKILFLMPYNAIYSNFSQMVSYKLGNIVIDLPMMTIITYIFMMVIALICAKKTYSKHQVE